VCAARQRKVLEALRRQEDRHSLDAGVTLYAGEGQYDLLKQYERDLPFISLLRRLSCSRKRMRLLTHTPATRSRGSGIPAVDAKGAKCAVLDVPGESGQVTGHRSFVPCAGT